MTDTTPNHSAQESLSSLVDGELGAHISLSDLGVNSRADWNAYQTIGDVLRTPRAASAAAVYGADPAFLQRLAQRLDHEQIHASLVIQPPVATAVASVAKPQTPAANDSTFRWKMLAGLASFGAVAAVAWTLVGTPGSSPGPQLASTSATELVVASPQGPMVRDARLEELLSAHKQLGGTSLQAPSGFLRHAGFESTTTDRR